MILQISEPALIVNEIKIYFQVFINLEKLLVVCCLKQQRVKWAHSNVEGLVNGLRLKTLAELENHGITAHGLEYCLKQHSRIPLGYGRLR